MSPDIQELKRLAEAATQGRWLWWPGSDDALDCDMGKFVTEDGHEICNFGNCETYYPTEGDPPNPFDAAYIAAASPATILALIEVAEAADRLERNVGALSIAEIEVRQAISNTNWEVIQHWREKVRTALEGVKK